MQQQASYREAKGIVASGHQETSRAAAEILRAGGNAYDAVLAALCAACIAEPLLASLGGGGYLLAAPIGGQPVVFDFFCQTPRNKRPEAELDFYPIWADFGADRQEFHIGMGAIAVPGVIAGIFDVHHQLGQLPLPAVVQPAIDLAHRGVPINAMQHYTVRILEPILRADPDFFRLFESPLRPGELINQGELFRNPDLASTFALLASHGPGFFYGGEWGQRLVADSAQGGQVQAADLDQYRVIRRKPLEFPFGGKQCLINPAPSPGGGLIAFALGLLPQLLQTGDSPGSPGQVFASINAMRAASLARDRFGLQDPVHDAALAQLLLPGSLAEWAREIRQHSLFSRGTTHISVADSAGNLASLSVSNGEGNAYVLPGTGIILNNMLGEEDLNSGGFHQWQASHRLASMMSPMVAKGADGYRLALGSGGSNRIRSAITQVALNVLHYGMPLEQAVNAPRLHLEGQKLSLEPGFQPEVLQNLAAEIRIPGLEIRHWPDANLFFGGVHAVEIKAGGGFSGAADLRRGGAVEIA
ncbi:MAG TPA: gamma-glutamyltransferase [Xanthomonadales bacterium]|nr:gamma-glutamyltransferase [Xanthomonadales bacterium]